MIGTCRSIPTCTSTLDSGRHNVYVHAGHVHFTSFFFAGSTELELFKTLNLRKHPLSSVLSGWLVFGVATQESHQYSSSGMVRPVCVSPQALIVQSQRLPSSSQPPKDQLVLRLVRETVGTGRKRSSDSSAWALAHLRSTRITQQEFVAPDNTKLAYKSLLNHRHHS